MARFTLHVILDLFLRIQYYMTHMTLTYLRFSHVRVIGSMVMECKVLSHVLTIGTKLTCLTCDYFERIHLITRLISTPLRLPTINHDDQVSNVLSHG
jgi:hypothetical protein